jgi:pyruvate,water dikinase
VTPGVSLERVDFEYKVEQDGGERLRGVAASTGLARGPARLVSNDGDFDKMRAGDVLVCRSSTLSWVPLFTMAAAVVTEIGGSLSHAAVVAREFGVPAVVAVDGALSTLTDGEPLEVDGSAGIVRRLFPVAWSDPEDAKLVWRRDDAHHTGVITPLAIESTRNGPGYGVRRRDEKLGPPALMRFEAFNGRIYTSTKALRPPDEMAEHQRVALARRQRLARRIRRDWDERYLPELDEIYAGMGAIDPERLSRDEAVAAWDDLWKRHRRAWTIHMLVTAGSYTVMDELSRTYTELVGGPAADAFALTQGLAPTLQRLDKDLHDLAVHARRSPEVAAAVARGASLDEVRAIDAAFGKAVETFLAVHGDAGQSREGIGAPSWSDDPALLLGTIAPRIAHGGEDPDVRGARLRRNADGIAARVREALATRPADLARFEEVLAAARSAGPLTEEHNYWLDRRNQAFMGRAVRRFGARLVRDGVLRAADEIVLLYVGEIRDALAAPRDLAELIAERRAEQDRWRSMEAPETVGGPAAAASLASGTTMVAMSHLLFKARQDDPNRILRGAGASAGIARGPARLVRSLDEFAKFRGGDVLVCQSSNVSWIPLFVSASAVVTETGGALSHAAVVAREFGVPAVVGTGVALSTLVDGEPLEVDGTAGTVRRLEA